jgi:hypothetical protein
VRRVVREVGEQQARALGRVAHVVVAAPPLLLLLLLLLLPLLLLLVLDVVAVLRLRLGVGHRRSGVQQRGGDRHAACRQHRGLRAVQYAGAEVSWVYRSQVDVGLWRRQAGRQAGG